MGEDGEGQEMVGALRGMAPKDSSGNVAWPRL